jgi:NitT/TauT family transport system substrate-binding protein
MVRLISALRALGAAAILALAACGQASPASQPSGAPVNLTVNYTAVSGTNSAMWTAYEAGYFKAENLNVHFVHIPSTSRAIPALLSGQVQLSTIDGLGLAEAVGKGADLKFILGVNNKLVFSVMASPRIQSPQDLKGKKIGVTNFGGSTYTAALQAFRIWGLKPDDATFLQLSEVPNILAALQSGQIDAGVVSPPTNSRARKAGFKELINLAVDGPPYLSVGLAATGSFISTHRDVLIRFIKAYARGLHRFKTDRKFAMQAINKFLKLSDQLVLADTWQQFSRYEADPPYVDTQALDATVADAAAKDPKLKGAPESEFADTSLVGQLDKSGFFKGL